MIIFIDSITLHQRVLDLYIFAQGQREFDWSLSPLKERYFPHCYAVFP